MGYIRAVDSLRIKQSLLSGRLTYVSGSLSLL